MFSYNAKKKCASRGFTNNLSQFGCFDRGIVETWTWRLSGVLSSDGLIKIKPLNASLSMSFNYALENTSIL